MLFSDYMYDAFLLSVHWGHVYYINDYNKIQSVFDYCS